MAKESPFQGPNLKRKKEFERKESPFQGPNLASFFFFCHTVNGQDGLVFQRPSDFSIEK